MDVFGRLKEAGVEKIGIVAAGAAGAVTRGDGDGDG